MLAKVETSQDGSYTVFIQTGRFLRPAGQIVIGILIRVYRAALKKVDGLIQYTVIPGAPDVAAHRQRQPEVIVGAVCAHAAALRRMPPVLYIPLGELTACGKKEVLTREARFGVDERHHVLQLIAKTEGAPGLVVAASRPQAACQRLVQEPAVGQAR